MRREILPRIPSIDEIEELVRDDAQERDYLIRHETDDVLHLRHHRHPKLHNLEAENRGGIFPANLFVEVERELEQDEEEELQHKAADQKLEDGVLPLEPLAEAPENNSRNHRLCEVLVCLALRLERIRPPPFVVVPVAVLVRLRTRTIDAALRAHSYHPKIVARHLATVELEDTK